MRKIISKYCWIGFLFLGAGLFFYLAKLYFLSGLTFGSGVTIIILNLLRRLVR